MIAVDGTALSDRLNAISDGDGQIHIRGRGGDDVIRLGFSADISVPTLREQVNGHHVYGHYGADTFAFTNTANVARNDARFVGRIDDFDPSHDTILVNGRRVDVESPFNGVRIVAHLEQQWLLIGDNILYALEGARRSGRDPLDEERHFVDWPAAWLNGVPKSADVPWVDPMNFIPKRHYDKDAELIYGSNKIMNGTDGDDHIFAEKRRGVTDQEIRGGAGNDLIDATQGNDTVYGDAGHDKIAGGLDEDLIYGGTGNDTLWGGTENDTLVGQSGNDVLIGGRGDDLLYGGSGRDVLWGESGNDRIWGRDGNDRLSGGEGNDLLLGEDGNDMLRGNAGDDRLDGNRGDDTIKGGSGRDYLAGGKDNDKLDGGSGRDSLYGESGNDDLWGNAGNDGLVGGSGRDTLNGGEGNDILRGGSGADTFLFFMDHGRDVVRDFNPDQAGEVINLRGLRVITDFEDLMDNHARADGADVLIHTYGGNAIRLQNVALQDLSADDFIF